LHVTGTFGAPRFDGVLGIQDGELRLVADVPTLSGLQARIVFSGDDARLEQLEGELGAGSFAITGEVRGLMHDPTLDLGFRGRSILVTRREGLRVRADADLAIDGPLSALVVRGEMRVRDGRYTTNFDILDRLRGEDRNRATDEVAGFDLPSIRRGPLASAEFDVVVRSEEPFRVANNILRTGLRPDLRLRGTGANPELYGEVFVDPGRLFLPAGTMYLKGGAITLPRDSPIVPRLELTGEARMAGYDIRLRVSGPYDHPIVTLSSTPQLTNSDLTLLVITGRLPQSTGVASQQDTAQNVAVYFGQDLISRWLTNDEDEDSESLLERIEWQQGQEVTQNGGRTASVGVRLSTGDPTARRAIYLRGEKDVYDRINYGVRVLFRFE
jgi:translocation and assembly module TamB